MSVEFIRDSPPPPPVVIANRNGPPEPVRGHEEYISSRAAAEIEDALPCSACVGEVHPSREGRTCQRADDRSDRQCHVIVATVESYCVAVIAGDPLGAADERSVIALARPIERVGSCAFVKLPPADKIWVGDANDGNCRQAPNVARMRGKGVELVHPPVVLLTQFQRPGSVGCGRSGAFVGVGRAGLDIGEIVPEVHVMQFCAETSRPVERYVGAYEFGAVGRDRSIGLLGRNHEAPDIAGPGTFRVLVVDLVDPPIIGRARYEPFGIGKPDKAYYEERHRMIAAESCGRAFVDVGEIFTHVHIVRNRETSGRP